MMNENTKENQKPDDGQQLKSSAQPAGYTPEQQATIDRINQMGHEEMCSLWRFAKVGHPYFDKTLPYVKVFEERLFKHFGGFTPEISKSIGW
jgi:hypothetical protein